MILIPDGSRCACSAALRIPGKQARAAEEASRGHLEQLQNEVATLGADLKRYTDKVMQVEIAHESERLARETLTERLEKLLAAIGKN